MVGDKNDPRDAQRQPDWQRERTARIADLNDQCRRAIGTHARVMLSPGIMDLPADARQLFMAAVQSASMNDALFPDGERDTGYVTCHWLAVLWRIFYFDPTLESLSEDPADPQRPPA